MNDDLKLNNIPSAELEKLSLELEEKNRLSENTSAQTESESTAESDVTIASGDNNELPVTQNTDNICKDVQNVKSVEDDKNRSDEVSPVIGKETRSGNVFLQNPNQSPPNTNSNRPPRTNTLRNRNAYPQNNFSNSYTQNGYQYPPNTSRNNQYPRTNTVRNRNSYPPNNYNNAYYQNGYGYSQNVKTTTAGNRNAYPRNNYNYPQNAYRYPPNMNNPVPANAYFQAPQLQNQAYAPPYYYQPNPKELEKLALSKDASTAGKVTIAIYIVMFLVAIIIEVIAVFCGVSKNVPDLANDPYAGFTVMGFYMYEGLTSLLSIFIPTLIIIKASGKKINKLMPFKKIEGKKLFAIVMCGMSLCMVAQLMASLIGINFSLFGIDIYEGLETATATGIIDLIMGTICTAIIPALVEEFAYRGLVAGILKEHDEMLAVFGSAFLFGMLHGNFGQIPFAFVVGLVLGYARIKTDSMLPGILIHFGNNFYATVITILDEIVPEPYSTVIDAVVILVLLAAGFIAANYLVKNHKDLFKIEKKQSYLTYKEKINTFLKTGSVIASIIVLTIMSFVVLLVV